MQKVIKNNHSHRNNEKTSINHKIILCKPNNELRMQKKLNEVNSGERQAFNK